MFDPVMGQGQLTDELSRIADEARSARARLSELAREALALRERLAVEAGDDHEPARKLQSVQ